MVRSARGLTLCLLFWGAVCGAAPGGALAQTAIFPIAEAELVRRSMDAPQRASFDRNREHCAYLGRTAGGRLEITPFRKGGRNGCRPRWPEAGFEPIASIHTHGAYDPDVPAEFPTTRDIDVDAAEGVNGYVATPGGRLWYLDSEAGLAVQVCGLGCLTSDPDFHAGDDGVIATRYTYNELLAIENGW